MIEKGSALRNVDGRYLNYVPDQDGVKVGCFSSQEFYQEVEPYERTFYIKSALWLALITPVGGEVGDGTAEYVFDPGQIANALWPFDITRIVFSDRMWETTRAVSEGDPDGWVQNTFLRCEVTFVRRRATDDQDRPVQVLSLYSQLQVQNEDGTLQIVKHPDGQESPYGVIRQALVVYSENGGGASPVYTYGSRSGYGDDQVNSSPNGALGGLITFSRFAAFCDMLTYDRHLVTVRKVGHKKKRVSWLTMAQAQARSEYEIVLRPEFTVYDAGEHISSGHNMRTKLRARPRRHRVGELTGGFSRMRNGKLEWVRPFERGGHLTMEEQPVYNTMPLAKWYTDNGEA